MKTIYFVRHGQSELNVAGRVAGHTDTPLTAEGRNQAKKAGQQAKDLGIEHIITSPLSRAMDTAKIIAKEIDYPEDKIEVNPMFIERNFGDMEAKPYKTARNYDVVKNAEHSTDLIDRAQRSINYLKTLPYKKILVVSHGSTGRALRHHIVKDQPFNHPVRFENAQIVEWRISL